LFQMVMSCLYLFWMSQTFVHHRSGGIDPIASRRQTV
jgi:hypothetical protein